VTLRIEVSVVPVPGRNAFAPSTAVDFVMSTKTTARKTRVLVTSQSLLTEFGRCCEQFPSLHIAVAWCGDPKQTPVFKLLKRFGNNLTATVGVAFCHTHPDAIKWLRDRNANVRVFCGDQILFHPKVYFFTDGERYAAFVGSSNLTLGGFHGNAEVNTLIEGTFNGGAVEDIRELQEALGQWHSPDHSFDPTDEWLTGYRDRYQSAVTKAKLAEVHTPQVREEAAATAGWLGTADWTTYYRRVLEGLRQGGRTTREYHDVLDAAAEELVIPWGVAYFDEAEKRRIMGGILPYGPLGHVAASPRLRKLLANGTAHEKQTIVNAINRIAALNHPLQWSTLKAELDRLTGLKSTMKVWGRFLCLVRPDLYCTVASGSVRSNLSEALEMAHSDFTEPADYIRLLRFVHSSPWFLSGKPKDPTEAAVWERRVAFMDPIFY
jgi:hypothetical protein